jgi:hypothetical protein
MWIMFIGQWAQALGRFVVFPVFITQLVMSRILSTAAMKFNWHL